MKFNLPHHSSNRSQFWEMDRKAGVDEVDTGLGEEWLGSPTPSLAAHKAELGRSMEGGLRAKLLLQLFCFWQLPGPRGP